MGRGGGGETGGVYLMRGPGPTSANSEDTLPNCTHQTGGRIRWGVRAGDRPSLGLRRGKRTRRQWAEMKFVQADP